MLLEFGRGKIGVMTYQIGDGAVRNRRGVALQKVSEKHDIGEQDPSVLGKDLNEVQPDCCLEFSNPESVQVLIGALQKIKLELEQL